MTVARRVDTDVDHAPARLRLVHPGADDPEVAARPPVAPGQPLATVPRLRLRALPQPQPEPWPPAPPWSSSAPAPDQPAFALHGLPRAVAEASFEDPVPTPTDELPCPDTLARSLVQAAVDVVRGHRPASQVLRWTTPEVYSQLRQRARLEQAQGRSGGRRPVVRSLRASPVGPRGVEVSAVVLDGPRARAVAARLDGEDGRWRLTALVIG